MVCFRIVPSPRLPWSWVALATGLNAFYRWDAAWQDYTGAPARSVTDEGHVAREAGRIVPELPFDNQRVRPPGNGEPGSWGPLSPRRGGKAGRNRARLSVRQAAVTKP